MSNIVSFKKPISQNGQPAVIRKIIDGEAVEFINVDALTPEDRHRLFSEANRAETRTPQPVID
jgi:hypothetical protein